MADTSVLGDYDADMQVSQSAALVETIEGRALDRS